MSDTTIINPFTQIPTNARSHVRGWSQYWANLIELELNEEVSIAKPNYDMFQYGCVRIDHGVNCTPGQLNLFGGVSDEVAARLIEIVSHEKLHVIALDHSMKEMNYIENLRSRIGQASTSVLLTPKLIDELERIFDKVPTERCYDSSVEEVFIGDSHTQAFAVKGAPVSRRNGMTLFGALRDGYFFDEVKKFQKTGKREAVTLCGGSIDIRHHIARDRTETEALEEVMFLANSFIKEAKRIKKKLKVDVSLCAAVPVEFEERRIPKSGYFEGTPFIGDHDLRWKLTDRFGSMLSDSKFDLITPPAYWYDMDPEEYAKEKMEANSSFHISPTMYRSNDWGESS